MSKLYSFYHLLHFQHTMYIHTTTWLFIGIATNRSTRGSLLVGLSPKNLSSCAFQFNVQVATVYGSSDLPKLRFFFVCLENLRLIAKLFPHPVKVFCMLLEPPTCHITSKPYSFCHLLDLQIPFIYTWLFIGIPEDGPRQPKEPQDGQW